MAKNTVEEQLLFSTRQFLLESGAARAINAVHMNAHLERELGIDSVGKAALIDRIEQTFNVYLETNAIVEAETLKDLLNAIQTAKSQPARAKPIIGPVASLATATETDLSTAETITDVLIQYALSNPDRPHVYLQNDEGEEEVLTYGQLFNSALQVACGLVQRGVKSGETVAIMLPTSFGFFYAFFGCLFAGAIPVPIYPPFRPDKIEEYVKREVKILQNAEIRVLITFSAAEMLGHIIKGFIPSLISVISPEALMINKGSLPKILLTADHPALIQYTSGSTGDPKGVLLLQRNLMANIIAIGKTLKVLPTDAVVSWLPLYHDMGLMSWLASLYYALPFTIMSPLTFLRRPERWLWAIHYHHATISAGPNFAYELCIKKISPERIEGLDLSHMRFAFNGAEAVNSQTLARFIKKFKAYGFRETTFFPVYGLAENTVALCFPQTEPHLRIDKISRSQFEQNQLATPIHDKTKDADSLEFVNCGNAIADHEIRIVNDNNELLPERHIGNLQFRGPSAMVGYYQNPMATQAVFHEGWWDTGDLGYLADKELYITGRKKDLIIKAGRNIHPEAIETVVNQILDIRKGCVVAFGVNDAKLGTEKLVVVAETNIIDKMALSRLQTEIIEQMSIQIGVPPDEVVLVKAQTIPKTSSGKLQRSACKQAYITHQLQQKLSPAYRQISKIFLISLWQKSKKLGQKCLRFIYSSYIWLIFLLSGLIVWPLAMITPQTMARKIIKNWLRLLFKLGACRISITGQENLFKAKPAIFAINHASFTDTALLITILPEDTLLIGKKELKKNLLLRPVIKKFPFIDVDRFDYSKNLSDMQRIEESLKNQCSIMIFPEGTFSYATGLRPFKAGAFQLAVNTQTAIIPIAINGTRKLLRSGSLLLNPTHLQVTIGEPIYPQDKDWNEVNRLRILVKQEIAKYCGEPTLDVVSSMPATKRMKLE